MGGRGERIRGYSVKFRQAARRDRRRAGMGTAKTGKKMAPLPVEQCTPRYARGAAAAGPGVQGGWAKAELASQKRGAHRVLDEG